MENNRQTLAEMKIFASEIRREILVTIAASGSMSYKNLKEDLSLTDGGLYYHLKKMKNYLEQDEQSFYRLNGKGKRLYNELFHEKDHLLDKHYIDEKVSSIGFINRLTPSNLVYYFLSTRVRSIIELNVVLLILAWLFGVTNTAFSSISTIFREGVLIYIFVFLIHWYLYYVLIAVILKLMKKDFNAIDLAIGVLLGTLPYVLFLIPVGILFIFLSNTPLWVDVMLTILLIVCKVWSILLITGGISVISKCNKLHALLITSSLILVDYIYLTIAL